MRTIKTITTAALAIAAAAALPMSAANASEGRSVNVSYADLNLATEAGQQVFDRRIEKAIEQLCGKLEGHPTFDSSVRRCQMETRVAAMQSRDIAVASYNATQLARGERREIRLVIR